MSTIELVDPELRDALAQWPLLPLTAESLTRRRANALELLGGVPKPHLPDIATNEIRKISPDGLTVTTFATGINQPRSIAFAPVPEPSSAALLAIAIGSLMLRRRRK